VKDGHKRERKWSDSCPAEKFKPYKTLAAKGAAVRGLDLLGKDQGPMFKGHIRNKAPNLWLTVFAFETCLLAACVGC
jgi:hypothetical protein